MPGKTHGATSGGQRTPEYTSWLAMHARCRRAHYKRHHGRGITIDERWKLFKNFLADMGHKPTPRHTLERIDNDGPYAPTNCRWATYEEQARNKSNNRVLSFRGRAQCLQGWADELGMSRERIQQRLKNGWTVEEALSVTGIAPHRRDPVTNRFIPRKDP
jgi:hypothetical protein